MVPNGDAAPAEGEPGLLSRPLTPRQTTAAIIFGMLLVACLIVIFMFVFDPRRLGIVFLVRVTDVHGLDPVNSPVIHPSFDLAVRVHNRGLLRDCWRNITVTIFYFDKVIGWGTVPDLCAGKGASVEAKAAMSHTDVVLTEALRSSMASQLAAGELELDVEMRMLFSKGYMNRNCNNCASRQGFQLCTTNPGQQGYAACEHVYLHKK